jgi:DNA-binding response OmpR family regulator
MLTAKGEEIDKVVGLESGADDYVTKPFGIHELRARIRAVLRRSRGDYGEVSDDSMPGVFPFGAGTVDLGRHAIIRDGRELPLTPKELRLVRVFRQRAGTVLDRDTLLNEAWGIDYFGTTRTLDQHVAQLRKKVEPDPSRPTVIVTIHGVGYRYDPDTRAMGGGDERREDGKGKT